MGSGPESASVAEGAPGCKVISGPKPSDAGEGAACPHRAKPGSGREPTRVGSDSGTRGSSLSPPSEARSGRERTRVGSGPDSACAAEGAPGGKGVAGPKPSDAGKGAACPHRAKPGQGREPTRVGSGADSSIAAEDGPVARASPGRSLATQERAQPLHTRRRRVEPGANSGGVRPRFSLRCRRRPRRQQRPTVDGPKQSDEGEVAASPHRAKPGSGRKLTRVRSGPDSACPVEDAPGSRGVARPKQSDAGEGAASPYRAKREGRRRAEAEQCRGGRSLFLPGAARVG